MALTIAIPPHGPILAFLLQVAFHSQNATFFLRAVIITVSIIFMIILLCCAVILLALNLDLNSSGKLSKGLEALFQRIFALLYFNIIVGIFVHFVGFIAAYKRNITLAYVYVAFYGLGSIFKLIVFYNSPFWSIVAIGAPDIFFFGVIVRFIIDLEKLKKNKNDRALIIPTVYEIK
ncbi:hypothetical protein BLOT_004981 [Blomia tropicalis]|nr:hypothetical protein BLOT_004981 [Blomia tropicalis]